MAAQVNRVAIVGSRDFPNPELVISYVNKLPVGSTVVSGGARGVDTFSEVAARKRGLNVSVHFAEWNKHGKSAGFIRNEDIVMDCDRVVAFWDGKSRGTKHTIDLARKHNKPCVVFTPNGNEINFT